MSKRIVIFASGNLFNIGGLQRSYALLTQYLVKHNFDVHLVGWKQKESNTRDLAYPLDKKVKISYILQSTNTENIEKIQNLLLEIKPDVSIIINSSQFGFFLLMLSKKLGIKTLYSIRGSSEYCLRYLWTTFMQMQVCFMNADAVHVLMPSYKDIYPDHIKAIMEDIPSQIEPAKTYAMPDIKNKGDRYIILYSGRYSFEKRVDILISAFSTLKDKYPEWDLWLYGNGPLEDEYKKLVIDLNLDNRVRFGTASNTDEMYLVYPETHIKVLPSEQEGCPMALREAMSHGIPVIGYDECSGTNEIIEDKKNGLLINSHNHLESLIAALQYLMDNPLLRKKLGEKAKEKAAEYTPDFINEHWRKLILDVCNQTGVASKKIREQYDSEFQAAEDLLFHLYEKKRFRNIYIYTENTITYQKFQKEYVLIYGHRLFDPLYYLENYIDVKKSCEDPLLHYITEGWKLGYNPSPEFNTNNYIDKYMNGKADICPLTHFYNNRYQLIDDAPIEEDITYFKKWPVRRPKHEYSFLSDSKIELEYLKTIAPNIEVE